MPIKRFTRKLLIYDLFPRPIEYLLREFDAQCLVYDDDAYMPHNYYTLVNHCQLYSTNLISDNGKCGLCAFCLVPQSNHDLVNKPGKK